MNGYYSPRFIRSKQRAYSPEIGDNIDEALAEELNRRVSPPPLTFEREAPGVYYYGLQKVFIILKLGNIFGRCCGE